MNKQIRQNIVLLCGGIVLWTCVLLYLDNHPGEKASIMPSLEILGQKVLWLGFRLVGKDPQNLVVKSSLIKNFDELAFLISSNPGCVDPDIIKTVQKSRDELADMSYDVAATQQYLYYSRAIEIKSQIEKDCK